MRQFLPKEESEKTKQTIFTGDDPEKQKFYLCFGLHFNKKLQYFYKWQWFPNSLKAQVALRF